MLDTSIRSWCSLVRSFASSNAVVVFVFNLDVRRRFTFLFSVCATPRCRLMPIKSILTHTKHFCFTNTLRLCRSGRNKRPIQLNWKYTRHFSVVDVSTLVCCMYICINRQGNLIETSSLSNIAAAAETINFIYSPHSRHGVIHIAAYSEAMFGTLCYFHILTITHTDANVSAHVCDCISLWYNEFELRAPGVQILTAANQV